MTRRSVRSWRQLLSIVPFIPIWVVALTLDPWVLLLLPLALIAAVWLERQIDRPLQIHLCPAMRF